ncbi:MAG: hypothetical protein II260_05775 [Muribaculaceae bacterium]|nr:hypothetical protein [Muribaculaceae bacterium]
MEQDLTLKHTKMQRKTAYRTFLNDFHEMNRITGKRGGTCSKSTLLIGFPFI